MWYVKFYYKDIVKVLDGFEERGFLFKTYLPKDHYEMQDKEIHSCFVRTEEEANILVNSFKDIATYAEKIEVKWYYEYLYNKWYPFRAR